MGCSLFPVAKKVASFCDALFPLVIPFFFTLCCFFSCYLHRRCFSLSFFFLPHLSSFFFFTLSIMFILPPAFFFLNLFALAN